VFCSSPPRYISSFNPRSCDPRIMFPFLLHPLSHDDISLILASISIIIKLLIIFHLSVKQNWRIENRILFRLRGTKGTPQNTEISRDRIQVTKQCHSIVNNTNSTSLDNTIFVASLFP
jgi:hypothetical protein